MFLLRLCFLTFAFLSAPVGASSQVHDPAGQWALVVDGRSLAILELRRDAQAPGGWTGVWTRPERFTISQMHEVFDIAGPVGQRRVLSAAERDGLIELTMEGRGGRSPARHTFRTTGPNHAEFGWVDPLAIPPIPLVRTDSTVAAASTWDAAAHYLITSSRPSSSEMTALFEADQDARRGGISDRTLVEREDAQRRARTRELLDSGALQSGTDFFHAAFIFQHGDEPADYILAHTFAVVAAARGRSDAAWIAAATLDRYLMSIGQPQVYGTQYGNRDDGGSTQEPYDRALVSDALRAALGVPELAVQVRSLEKREAQPRGQ